MRTTNGAVAKAPVQPKRSHYVSMHNNVIYPAMSSPAGFEDEHPEDYRPASPEEIAKYKAGRDVVVVEEIDLSDVVTAEAPVLSSPSSIRLQDDDVEATDTSLPPGPAPAISRPT